MNSQEKMSSNWEGYKNYDHFFELSQPTGYSDFIKEISESTISLVKIKGKEYINVPCTVDIETSSMYDNGSKFATMYLWGFGFNGSCIIGRTWDEFKTLLSQLSASLGLSEKRILTIYIQNLGYEFQWLRKRIKWEEENGNKKIFAMKERRPIYAVAQGGIEFKCSYFLSNYSLAYIGAELLKKYPVQKAVGDLDYSLIRHSETPLTEKEKWYQVQDLQVVMSYIQEKIENDGDITEIPLTNTGYVRKYCRGWCFTNGEQDNPTLVKKIKAKYHQQMKNLTIKTEREYDQLRNAFGGGFTHAAAKYSGQVLHNVKSKDEASAYPGAMVSDYFPMSAGIFIGDVSLDRLQFYLKYYCCLFTVTLFDVTPRFIYENYISLSHCTEIEGEVTNNGRVASADYLTTTITELDWDIITKAYDADWSKTQIKGLRIYQRDYLPRSFILAILNLYKNKTSLKGVEGKETEYMVSKNMINASFGMAVTAIVRSEITYDMEWGTEPENKISQLIDYNKNYNRFLYYPWGVWVTAHARHNLWDAIFELGKDYVYSDTDSTKYINPEKHEEFFNRYNTNMKLKLLKMCNHYDIPFSMCQPETVKGVKKLIGIWEDDGVYTTFKTIGAKRYIYEYSSGEINFTISGVNKHYGVPYLLHRFSQLTDDESYSLFKLAYSPDSRLFEESKKAMKKVRELHKSGKLSYDSIFENFNEGLYFPNYATGKQTITYIDKPTIAMVTDYLGNKKSCIEWSSIHMEPQDYSMSRTQEYLDFLFGFSDASI